MVHGTEDKRYGLLAEFEEADQLLEAANRTREAGYRHIDTFTPYPVERLVDAAGTRDDRVPWVVFFSGATGALCGLLLQSWVSSVDYPLNVGGRPFFSWPSFIPVTFEMMVLFAAFGALIGMLALNGLPLPHHPLFNSREFERVHYDRFFLCIQADDPQFDQTKTREFLEGLGALSVTEVER